MKHLGKKIIKYGEIEVIGDEYEIPIINDTWDQLLSVANKTELQAILETQIRLENFEAAAEVQRKIKIKYI